jgi:hypothetical protein
VRKFVHVKKQHYGLDPYIPSVGLCPYCRNRNFVGRKNSNWLKNLLTGGWWCRECERPFRKTIVERLTTR